MALETAHVTIPFGLGVDTKPDPRLVQPPTLLTAQNVVYAKMGRPDKRRGYAALTTGGLVTGATVYSLFTRGDELGIVTNGGTYTLSNTRNVWRRGRPWSPPYGAMIDRVRAIWRGEVAALNCDMAVSGTQACIVWQSGTTPAVSVMLYDLTANNAIVILSQTVNFPFAGAPGVGGQQMPRVVAVGATFVITAHNIGDGMIYATSITTTGTLYAALVNVSTVATNSRYDTVADIDGATWHVAYSQSADNNIRLSRRDTTLAAVQADLVPAPVRLSNQSIGIYQHPTGQIIVGLCTPGGALRVFRVNADYTGLTVEAIMAALLGTNVNNITMTAGHTQGGLTFVGYYVIWDELADAIPAITGIRNIAGIAGDMAVVRYRGYSTAGAAPVAAQNAYNLSLAAKAFQMPSYNSGSRACAVLAYTYVGDAVASDGTAFGASLQPVEMICALQEDELDGGVTPAVAPWGLLARIHGDKATQTRNQLSRVESAPNFRYASIVRPASATQNLSVAINGVDMAQFSLTSVLTAVERNGLALWNGGALYAHDGACAYENTPNQWPERPYYIDNGAGNVDPGIHLWRVIWTWEDLQGNVHRSAPSPPLQINVNDGVDTPVLGAPGRHSITIVFPSLGVNQVNGVQGARNMRATVYRTIVNGSRFFETVTGVPVAVVGGVVGMVSLIDNATDATIGVQAVLYTDGGVLPNDPPPAFTDLVIVKDRMFGLSAENPREVWYTKPLQGFTAPEWYAGQILDFGESRTGLVALGVIDDKLIGFSANEIFAVLGDGPDALGLNNTFTMPQRVSSDTGCMTRSSVVAGPFGLMFQSQKGIYTLTRDLQLVYTGAPVDDLLVSGASGLPNVGVTKGTLVNTQNQVHFAIAVNGTVLVYNYLYDVWTHWTQHEMLSDAIIYQGRYTWCRSDARFRQYRTEVDTSPFADVNATDAAIFIPTIIETAWVRTSGVQGFQRLRRLELLGLRSGAHTLTVEARYDYEGAYTTTWTFSDAEILAVRYRTTDGSATRYQLGFHLPHQKTQAVAFRFSDANATPSGGFSPLALELSFGIKLREMPLPAAATK